MTARSPERERHSEKTELDTLPAPHTDAVHPPLSEEKDAELGALILLAHRLKETNVWELLPKLSLIRGDRTALQLMGGYWKLVPTDARGARAVFTRAGWANSGPAPTGGEYILIHADNV